MDRISGSTAIALSPGKLGFRDENLAAGQAGTIVTAAWLNGLQEELMAIIESAGFLPTDGNWQLLANAIQRRAQNYVVAAGTASAVTATLVPAPPSYSNGMNIRLRTPIALNAGATIDLNGLGPIPITRRDGSAIRDGDIVAGDISDLLIYNNTARLASLARTELPLVLYGPAAVTLYVRPGGNDANNGLVNTDAGAFRTIQAAIDYAVVTYGIWRSIIIRLGAAGTYDAPALNIYPRGTNVQIVGDTAVPASYIVRGGSSTGGGVLNVGGIILSLENVTVRNEVSGSKIINAYAGASVFLKNSAYAATTTTSFVFYATTLALIYFVGTHTISASATFCWYLVDGGLCSVDGSVIFTFTGAPTYTTVCNLSDLSIMYWSVFNAVVGSVTGKRYSATNNAVINTSGAGISAIPGTVAGTTATGGLYV